MFPIDMPSIPPQEQTIVMVQADSAQQQIVSKERTLGVCHPVPNSIPPEGARGEYVVNLIQSAKSYFTLYEHQKVAGETNVTVVKGPAHGSLQLITEANVATFMSGRFVDGNRSYAYFPNPGYVGNDRATFLVDIGGQKVKLVYFFQSVDHPLGDTGFDELCAKTGIKWKISRAANGNQMLTAMGSNSMQADTLASSLLTNQFGENAGN